MKRYARQTILPEVGSIGQEKLSKSSVLIVGAGGLGCPVALYLAAAGVGRIGLIDPDSVDESNLQRQILFSTEQVGLKKVAAAAQRLSALNPEVQVDTYAERLHAQNAVSLFQKYDLIIDGTDNFPTKYLINDAAVKLQKPVVYGALSHFEGRVSLFNAPNGPCYRCVYPEAPKSRIQNCAEAGILGSVAGIVGSLQATEAMKYLLATPQSALKPLIGRMIIWNVACHDVVSLPLKKSKSCPVCSKDPAEISLSDAVVECELVLKAESVSPHWLLTHGVGPHQILVDVREREEWNEGHLPGAVHWPLGYIREGKLPSESEGKEYLLYCRSGMRSAEALNLIKGMGLYRAKHMEGGILAWTGELQH